jgi:hypothetical protein
MDVDPANTGAAKASVRAAVTVKMVRLVEVISFTPSKVN